MNPLVITRYEHVKDNKFKFIKESTYLQSLDNTLIDDGMLKTLIKYYDGCQIYDLVTLWIDNYNSLMALDLTKEKHNTSTFIIINKLMAIAAIVKEKY